VKFGRLVPLALLALWCLLSCKAMPQTAPEEGETAREEGFDGGDVDAYGYEGGDSGEAEDVPELALPPVPPSDAWSWDLIEPSLETGEVFLPDSPPAEETLALPEPLPEPAPPDVAEEPPREDPEEGPSQEELAEEPPPEEPPAPESAPGPEPPPPPPRIVQPAKPLPPPPPVREIVPMPPNAVPDLPAPSALAPAPASSGDSSRIVRALAGQTVEVPFRGNGWVYLGESSSQKGVDYASRRLDREGQTFVFRALEPGTYELKFYRQDFIRDYILNDLVTVLVAEPPLPPRSGLAGGRGTVVAEPRWPALPGETAPAARTESPDPAALTAAEPSGEPGAAPLEADPESPPVESPLFLPWDAAAEEYLEMAREAYQGERYPDSTTILDQFLARFPRGSDEAYWLYAQVCEKQGPTRNIRLALDYYRRLVAEYPQSGHYNDARRRIAYLERYYINIQ
jgi:hypothetical protein